MCEIVGVVYPEDACGVGSWFTREVVGEFLSVDLHGECERRPIRRGVMNELEGAPLLGTAVFCLRTHSHCVENHRPTANPELLTDYPDFLSFF